MSKLVNIHDLDKAALLEFTYPYAQSYAMMQGSPAGFAESFRKHDTAKEIFKNGVKYVDYFNGRPIKIDFSKSQVDPFCFDRDSSKPFAEIVHEFRMQQRVENKQ